LFVLRGTGVVTMYTPESDRCKTRYRLDTLRRQPALNYTVRKAANVLHRLDKDREITVGGGVWGHG
jgi:hypothetical protein